jgi:hypothetical protein
LFYFEKDSKDLKRFIRENFVAGKRDISKIQIDKNNFVNVFQKWATTVQPTILFDWETAKKHDIISGDFYLADLLSEKNITLLDKLDVVLRSTQYEMNRYQNVLGAFTSSKVEFTDNQKAYNQFWTKYERPPKEDYWDFMIDHRHLLVPQDIREVKGSYYTPQEWVEKSQEYLADVFGEDWQEEYYIWDCCAGTGNLLAGLVNKDRIFASTLDKQDVDVIKQRIANGANLWENQVFQFDFLNDDFKPISKNGKLPDKLSEIINDKEKRKKLLIYINPPYADASSTGQMFGTRQNKTGVAKNHKTKIRFQSVIGKATNELFAQFLARIYTDLSGCKIGEFSTLKAISGTNFIQFRNFFLAKLEKAFIVPANTFDNVNGHFPVGFKIWNTENKIKIKNIQVDVFDKKQKSVGHKMFYSFDGSKYINDWLRTYKDTTNEPFGILKTSGNDFQNQNFVTIEHNNVVVVAHRTCHDITLENFDKCAVYYAVRKVIPATWLNDRDQFLYPNDKWKKDIEFQNDCIAYCLFENNVQSKHGRNHWIPFSEKELGISNSFDSHFMHDFINGKLMKNGYTNLFEQANTTNKCIKREFSSEANAVFAAGKEIWKHYHWQDKKMFEFRFGKQKYNVNASYYDIRAYFKGFETDKKGKERMNNKSADEKFNELEKNLSQALNILAQKIEPKVYEYEFLMK